jgi:hypothetical protein
MSTKQNPGRFDCYSNAMDDEEMFILLGRDKMSGALVRLWAEMREREGENPEVVKDARECADRLEACAKELGKPVLTLDAIVAFASMLRDQKMDARRSGREETPAAPKVEWQVGEHAMTIHSKSIGVVERILEPFDSKDPARPSVKEPMAAVRYSRDNCPTIPLQNLRKPTTEEVNLYYESRFR